MRSLLRFLVRYHTIILFLLLEIVAFALIANFNSFQRSKLFQVKHGITSGIERRFEKLSSYIHLTRENKELAQENARLYNLLPDSHFNPDSNFEPDSSADKKFYFIGAKIINNSTNKQYNYLTLNKGSKDGIEPEMAVICKDGIVGTVKETTQNFSTVISVLNRESFTSAKIKRNNAVGLIEWDGRNYRRLILREIPIHITVEIGDTIVTSGNSSTFPSGLLIGTVSDYTTEEGILHKISVDLTADFKKLNHVIVVKNTMRQEQLELEERIEND